MKLGFAAAIVASVLFGVGGTCAQFLFTQRGVSVDWLVTMRLLCAGAVLLAMSGLRDWRGTLAVWRDWRSLLPFGIVGMLGVQYTYMAAIAASNTATATVLQYTAPAMIAVWLAGRARAMPSVRDLAAIALALLGVFLLVTHGNPGRLRISGLALIWGLASAATAGFNALFPAGLLHRHGTLAITGWGMLVGGLALSLRRPPWTVTGTWDGEALLFLAFILSFGTLLAFYLYLKAVRMIGGQICSILTSAEPLSAAVLSVFWLGVGWNLMDWLGMALVLATIGLLAHEQGGDSQLEKVT